MQHNYEYKLIKDPVYGYIEIERDVFLSYIDTPSFQRLRNILQTSYLPLYPSSLHNRFVHSLGVYYLGKKVFNIVESSILANEKLSENFTNSELKRLGELFCLACLLHDIGHAPFSHTGEYFFLDQQNNNKIAIRELLGERVGTENFLEAIESQLNKKAEAAPHEIMSCIVALNIFKESFKDGEEREFFSRCIMGYLYESASPRQEIKNCLIKLLSSTIIDIDRLDYIIRDAYSTGYKSVQIDVERLLNGICIIEKNNKIMLAYDKSALAVIENVVYAHDSERKWIQQHPTILYEHFILNHVMKILEKSFPCLFTEETLLPKGNKIANEELGEYRISLFADEDVLFFMKNVFWQDELSSEYFDRNKRRHPIWKSEAEYYALFNAVYGEGRKMQILEEEFSILEEYLFKSAPNPIINCELRDFLVAEEEIAKEAIANGMIDSKRQNDVSIVKRWVDNLYDFSNELHLEFNFVVLSAKKFQSNFAKEDLSETNIYFSSIKRAEKIKKVSSLLNAEKKQKESQANLFYVFYRQPCINGKRVPIDKQKFADLLVNAVQV